MYVPLTEALYIQESCYYCNLDPDSNEYPSCGIDPDENYIDDTLQECTKILATLPTVPSNPSLVNVDIENLESEDLGALPIIIALPFLTVLLMMAICLKVIHTTAVYSFKGLAKLHKKAVPLAWKSANRILLPLVFKFA